MTRPTVILADDHAVVIEGLKRILAEDFEVVATASDGAELVAEVEARRPDLVVVDLSMPNVGGLEAIERIDALGGGTRMVVLTMHRDEAYAVAALDAGARGYVLKHADPSELVTALHEALAGNVYVSNDIAADVEVAARSGRAAMPQLTRRQREVVALVAQGRSLKQIGADLGISAKTVEYHKYRVMQLLGVDTTAELIRLELEHREP